MEKWKDIDGFPGYQVSNEGRVRSYRTYHRIMAETSHILRPRVNPNGYEIATLYDEYGRPHQVSVHRLVATAFLPNSDPSLVVDHLDYNKTNNNVRNLEWVTIEENSRRACRAGLYEAAFIVTRRPIIVTDLWTGEEIYYKSIHHAARMLGYSPSAISKVVNGHADHIGHYTAEYAGREERLLYGWDD